MKPQPKSIPVKILSAQPPYIIWQSIGFLPFTIFGEKFAVTKTPNILTDKKWGATHIETGARISGILCRSKFEVPAKAKAQGKAIGRHKFEIRLLNLKKHLALYLDSK